MIFRIIQYQKDYLIIVGNDPILVGDWYLSLFDKKMHRSHKGESIGKEEDARKIIAHLPLRGSKELDGVDLLPQIITSRDLEDFMRKEIESSKIYHMGGEKIEGATKRMVLGMLKNLEVECRRDPALIQAQHLLSNICEWSSFRDHPIGIQAKQALALLNSVTEETPIVPFSFVPEGGRSLNIEYTEMQIYDPKIKIDSKGKRVWVGKYE